MFENSETGVHWDFPGIDHPPLLTRVYQGSDIRTCEFKSSERVRKKKKSFQVSHKEICKIWSDAHEGLLKEEIETGQILIQIVSCLSTF